MTTQSLASVEEALGSIRAALEADGYELTVGEADGQVELRVAAGAGACEDCLVPKHMFLAMASSALNEQNIQLDPESIKVVYPVDSH